MKYNVGNMFAGLNAEEEAIAVGIGGLLIGSAITHGEIIGAMSTTIMKAAEIAIGTFQVNTTLDSSTSRLLIASASFSTALIHQKDRGNMGAKKERSRWEIIADMLLVLQEEKKPKKTRIMQRACLDWRNFQRYFEFLLEEGFIAKSDNPEVGSYELTEKGRELLKRLKDVGELLNKI